MPDVGDDSLATEEMAVIALPVPPQTVVGASLRPPRAVTVGRRSTDRWLAWLLIVLLVASVGVVLFHGYLGTRLTARLDTVDICQHEEVRP